MNSTLCLARTATRLITPGTKRVLTRLIQVATSWMSRGDGQFAVFCGEAALVVLPKMQNAHASPNLLMLMPTLEI